tara:strand:- start:14852 stop:15157 length:306 start_codon:yes stop_codon:yes gene_type:complete
MLQLAALNKKKTQMGNLKITYDHNGLAHEVAKALAFTGEDIRSGVAFWLMQVAGKALQEINGHFYELEFEAAVKSLIPRYAYNEGSMALELTYKAKAKEEA